MPKMPKPLSQIGIEGMRDSLDPQTADQLKANLLQNVYPENSQFGGAVVGRPGFELSQDSQLGTAGVRQIQLLIQYSQLDGGEKTIAFVGGKMYDYNWGAGTWGEVTLVGVSVPTTGRIFGTVFADKLLINPNDGTNKPFTWDDTTFVSLTDAPLAYGKPAVYYAKVFFVKWSERSTIAWSEENDPTTGYEAGGYNNAWTLGQTDQEALFALHGTNEALYYFRERSIGAIRGAVTTDFVNSGVRDGVSETVGTNAPDGVVGKDRDIYFIDADGKPRLLRAGIGVEDSIWRDLTVNIGLLPMASITNAVAIDYGVASQIWFGVPKPGDTQPTQYFVLTYEGQPRVAAIFDGFPVRGMGMVKDAAGTPVLFHGDADGYVYAHGDPIGGPWNDSLKAGTEAILHVVIGGVLGYDTKLEKHWHLMDVSVRLQTGMSGVEVEYMTPYGSSAVGTLPNLDGGAALWDSAIWDTDLWSIPGLEQHAAVGLAGYGRWMRPKLRHATLSERFGLDGFTVQAFPALPHPLAR